MENVLVRIEQLQPSGVQFQTAVLFEDTGSSIPKRRKLLQTNAADDFATLLSSDPSDLLPEALFSQYGQIDIYSITSSTDTAGFIPLPAGTYQDIDWLSEPWFDTATLVTEMPTPVSTTDMPTPAPTTPAPTTPAPTNDTTSVELFEPTLVYVYFAFSFSNGDMEDLVEIGPIYLDILSGFIGASTGGARMTVSKQPCSCASLPVSPCLKPVLPRFRI